MTDTNKSASADEIIEYLSLAVKLHVLVAQGKDKDGRGDDVREAMEPVWYDKMSQGQIEATDKIMAGLNEIHDAYTEWLIPFLRMTSKYDCLDELWHRCDGEWAPVTFFVNVNDVFFWGCADGEEIRSLEDVRLLEKSIEDCLGALVDKDNIELRLNAISWGGMLYACRKRKCRPQGGAYPENKVLWPLVDAAGPERPIDFGNPMKPGGEYCYKEEKNDKQH